MSPDKGPKSCSRIARTSVKNRYPLTQQNPPIRRLHRHMKRDSASLVIATLRTGFLVAIAAILILVLFPAITAQAASPR